MKQIWLGDTHFGARNDHAAFHDYFERFYRDELFPYMRKHDIKRLIQFGDMFDRRKYINFNSLARSREYFFEPMVRDGIICDVFVGNHDTFYKNTNKINSPSLLLGEYDNINIYTDSETVYYDDVPIALMPWINAGNYDESLEFIEKTPAQILLGHLELSGFEMHRGAFHDHGMSAEIFDKFDIVASGHFHHRSTKGNIHYLGTPYEMTWSDFNDPRGFHVFDTDTREMEFIQNPHRMFHKIHYDDLDKTQDEILPLEQDLSGYDNTIVKVIVHNKTNPYWFDLFIDRLEKAGTVDLDVVEDHLHLDLEDDEDIIDEAEDTLTILRKASAQVCENVAGVDAKTLDKFMTSLYNEALNQE